MMKKAPYMPSELINEILVNLSVKSLLRFKLVCKLWFSFISDSTFANSNFQLAQTHTRRILSVSHLSPLKVRSIDFELSSLNHKFTSRTLNLTSHPVSKLKSLTIRGSCRGFLFLFHNVFKFSLWNPSTGFHRPMRFSPFHSSDKACFRHLYSFGYDQARDDYLVVVFSYTSYNPFLTHLEFFSLRDNTWTKVEGTHYPWSRSLHYYSDSRSLFFNGATHWMVFCPDKFNFHVILVFDLMEKKLSKMCLPDDLKLFRGKCNVWVFEEFFSLWALRDGIVEVWVMKEYKVHSSWTKTLVLPVVPYFTPIYSTKSGDIIGICSAELLKYNGKGKLLEKCSCSPQAGMYTASLLSLPDNINIEQV